MSKSDKRSYPLRKVVERDILVKDYEGFKGWNRFCNRLECGHLVPPAKDFYGEIHSDSQRCKKCHESR